MQQAADRAATARLFLALIPGPQVQNSLAAHAAAWRWNARAHRYAAADWHVTLHFLGAVPRIRLGALCEQLKVPFTAFELCFGQPMLWPHGLAVLLPTEIPADLRRLREALGARLRELGLPTDDRPYRPHLTLARRAPDAVAPVPPAWGWPVRGYVLMESTGDPAARYRIVCHYGDAPEAADRHSWRTMQSSD